MSEVSSEETSPLNPVESALKRIVAELSEAQAPCALIGGLAVSARAEPRTRVTDASKDDLRQAREALSLIEARGYNRGRRLGDDLTRAVADTSR